MRNLKLACKSEMTDNMGRQKIFSSLEDGKFCNDVFRPCECEYLLCFDMYVEISMSVRCMCAKGENKFKCHILLFSLEQCLSLTCH